jgi:hypothetical protein
LFLVAEEVTGGRARLGIVFDEGTANVEGLVEPAMIVEYLTIDVGRVYLQID